MARETAPSPSSAKRISRGLRAAFSDAAMMRREP